MTKSFHIQIRIQEQRNEIFEISAARNVRHFSGSEKVKHEKRIQTLWEIRNELLALIGKIGYECSRRFREAHSGRRLMRRDSNNAYATLGGLNDYLTAR